MKKLMIAAAAVAAGAGAYAASLDAQVYDVTLTVKTTTCKQIKYSKTIATLEGLTYSDVKKTTVDVRKQATTKIVGVIWGCDCETIANPQWRTYRNGKTVGGYLFWNPGAEEPFNVFSTTFGWAALNRIYKGDSAEGVWYLTDWDVDNTVGLLGAGFGKVSGTGVNWNARKIDCRVVLTSMSGSFAGFVLANSAAAGCQFCGSPCSAWELCVFCAPSLLDEDLTAAYGSWKIKYNSSASKKLRKHGKITQSYSFKKAGNTAARMARLEFAAERGLLATDDEDDEDFGYDELPEWADEWFEDYAGVVKDPADMGKFFYGSKDGEDDGDTWAPESYAEKDETNAFVLNLLGIEEEEDDAS